jgi:hypothetical protein
MNTLSAMLSDGDGTDSRVLVELLVVVDPVAGTHY